MAENGVEIAGADSSILTLFSIDTSDAGFYICRISNSIATDLTLFSRPLNLMLPPVVGITHTPGVIPGKFTLEQNYPNPFNPLTTINFTLDRPSFVKLKVFNFAGQHIKTLINRKLAIGNHSYSWNATDMASGLYFYQLQSGRHILTKKAILLK